MDGLTKLITQGNPTALKMVKSFLTTPTLINIDVNQGLPYALPLDCETYKQTGSAEVSENLLIVRTGKKYIADNVAPSSWTWELSGYIPGNKILEPTNYFTPFVLLNTDILKLWFKRGAVLIFKSMDAQIFKKVVIQSLTVEHNKECANAAPFNMTLKEINTLESEEEIIAGEQSSLVTTGSKLGNALKVGATVTSAAAITTGGVANILNFLAI